MLKQLVLISILLITSAQNATDGVKDSIQGKPICQDLVIPHQVPCEEHLVLTEDEFILSLVHLPAASKEAPVVFLQHGLLDSAATWVNQNTHESLGYVLWKQGFDVWAGNSRGNWYSLKSKKYDRESQTFWDNVDYDLMAKYDLPAFVQYVIAQTGRSKIAYVAHSQGTTQAFAAFTEDYNQITEKISVFIAMAPVAYVYHMESKLMKALAELKVDKLFSLFGAKSFPPAGQTAKEIMSKVDVECDNSDPDLCENILYDVEGLNIKFLNKTIEKAILGFDPAGTSIHNLQHWFQGMRNNRFAKYDYGAVGNLKHYGKLAPPKYDLSTLKVPVALYHGGKDVDANPQDVARLVQELPADKVIKVRYYDEYGHLDFVWSETAYEDLYKDVIAIITTYKQN